MNKQTLPLLATFAPAVAAATPPVLIGLAVGAALLWLFGGNSGSAEQQPTKPQQPAPEPQQKPALSPVAKTPQPRVATKRVRREDLAEALEYGARALTRQEGVAALQRLGFGKTAAYKAFSPEGRFAELIEIAPDGLIVWKG